MVGHQPCPSLGPAVAGGRFPLAGWRVLIPRAVGRPSGLAALLESEHALPQAVPLLAFSPPDDPAALDRAVLALSAGAYDWVGFTSVTAVEAVTARAGALAVPPVPSGTRVAAVGPASAGALGRAGISVDLTPPGSGSAAALVACWPAGPASVLLPQSAIAGPTLADGLATRGLRVDVVAAYRTRCCPPSAAVAAELATGGFDAVLLTSPSTVAALAGFPIAADTLIGVIGQTTAAAATAAGLSVDFVAADPTEPALVAGLVRSAGSPPAGSPADESPAPRSPSRTSPAGNSPADSSSAGTSAAGSSPAGTSPAWPRDRKVYR